MEEPRPMTNDEREALLQIKAQQTVILAHLDEIVKDHEKRLRFLERIVSYGVGAFALVKILLEYSK